jgi:hypothetical protein
LTNALILRDIEDVMRVTSWPGTTVVEAFAAGVFREEVRSKV